MGGLVDGVLQPDPYKPELLRETDPYERDPLRLESRRPQRQPRLPAPENGGQFDPARHAPHQRAWLPTTRASSHTRTSGRALPSTSHPAALLRTLHTGCGVDPWVRGRPSYG